MSQKGAIIIPITLVAEGGGSEATESFQSIFSPSSSSPSSSPSPNKGDKSQKKAEAQGKASSNVAKAVLVRAAAQAVNLALSGWGDVTGNYVTGQNIQTAVSEAGKIGAALSMGWAGVAVYAVDKGFQALKYVGDLKKSEARAEFAQKRVYGSTVKG